MAETGICDQHVVKHVGGVTDVGYGERTERRALGAAFGAVGRRWWGRGREKVGVFLEG